MSFAIDDEIASIERSAWNLASTELGAFLVSENDSEIAQLAFDFNQSAVIEEEEEEEEECDESSSSSWSESSEEVCESEGVLPQSAPEESSKVDYTGEIGTVFIQADLGRINPVGGLCRVAVPRTNAQDIIDSLKQMLKSDAFFNPTLNARILLSRICYVFDLDARFQLLNQTQGRRIEKEHPRGTRVLLDAPPANDLWRAFSGMPSSETVVVTSVAQFEDICDTVVQTTPIWIWWYIGLFAKYVPHGLEVRKWVTPEAYTGHVGRVDIEDETSMSILASGVAESYRTHFENSIKYSIFWRKEMWLCRHEDFCDIVIPDRTVNPVTKTPIANGRKNYYIRRLPKAVRRVDDRPETRSTRNKLARS